MTCLQLIRITVGLPTFPFGHTASLLPQAMGRPCADECAEEEKAQQEVDRLQQEFHKVHNDKNEKVTALTLGLNR